MRRGLVIALLLAIVALVGISQAQRTDAAFHIMRVYGVMGGASGDADVQYVELRMVSAGQTLVSGHHLCFYDASGSAYARFTFPSNVANGTLGSSILISTSEFDSAWAAGSSDFLFSSSNTVAIAGGADVDHPVRSPGGKVSFGSDAAAVPAQMCQASFAVVDSVAYGTGYSGAVDYGTKLNADLPTAGTSAVRLQGALCHPDYLPALCVRDNSTDYAITDVNTSGNNPRNNAGAAGPVGGPSVTTFNVLKDFVPDSDASVTVSLSCASGAVTPPSASASEGAPAAFTVTGFSGDPDCTATESPVPPGYVSNVTCVAPLAAGGQCTITNVLDSNPGATTESSFDVSGTVSVTSTSPGAARSTTTTITVPHPGNINLASLITFDPAGTTTQTCNSGLVGGLATTHTASGPCLRATDLAGSVSLDTRIGILNDACTQSLVVEFDLFAVPTPDTPANPRGSGNIAYTQPEGTADRFARWGTSPIGAGGGSPVVYGVEKATADNIAFKNYPEFLLDLFDADGPAGGGDPRVPLAVYGGISKVSGDSIPVYIVVFEPGALAAEFDEPNPLGRATTNLGYASQTVLSDPTATAASPGAVRAFCSTSVATTLSATVGGVTRATNPGAGTHFNLAWAASLRDVDNDGIENGLDTCPFTRNTDPYPRTAIGDPDGDLIDAACDPDGIGDTTTNAGSDVDSDTWPNLQDSCPQTANAGQSESELALGVAPGYTAGRADDGGPLSDSLGDACDSGTLAVTYNGLAYPALALSSTVANGRWQAKGLVVPLCYGGTDADGDGYCAGDTDAFDAAVGDNAIKHNAWTTDADINTVLGATGTASAGSWDTDGGGADTGVDAVPDLGYDSDWLETYIGIDARQPCALSTTLSDEPLDSWIFDVNDDQKATLGDVLAIAPVFLQTATTDAHRRFDWNGDGTVSLSDVLSIAPVFLKTCWPVVPPQ